MPEERSRARAERGRKPAPRRSGSAAPGRVRREPQLTHTRSRAGSVVAATTGLLGLSSTRRAAVLALVVCALALTVVVPLRKGKEIGICLGEAQAVPRVTPKAVLDVPDPEPAIAPATLAS